MKRIILTLTLALFTLPIAKAQDIKLNGTTSAESNQIKNVADPTDAQDAGTKSYIDALITNLQDQIDVLQASSGSGTVTDQDGNSYSYLTYGYQQVWTVNNAGVVTYRDGTAIPEVTDDATWENLTTGAWCYFDNDSSKGKLYNWYAVMGIHNSASLSDASQRKEFAPEGWHVTTDADWTILENDLINNGLNYDLTYTGNNIAKAIASTTGWNSSPNDGVPGNDQSLNNNSGFNAIPVGTRYFYGLYDEEGKVANFWTSTSEVTNNALYRAVDAGDTSLIKRDTNYLQNGFSVRFVRD